MGGSGDNNVDRGQGTASAYIFPNARARDENRLHSVGKADNGTGGVNEFIE